MLQIVFDETYKIYDDQTSRIKIYRDGTVFIAELPMLNKLIMNKEFNGRIIGDKLHIIEELNWYISGIQAAIGCGSPGFYGNYSAQRLIVFMDKAVKSLEIYPYDDDPICELWV